MIPPDLNSVKAIVTTRRGEIRSYLFYLPDAKECSGYERVVIPSDVEIPCYPGHVFFVPPGDLFSEEKESSNGNSN